MELSTKDVSEQTKKVFQNAVAGYSWILLVSKLCRNQLDKVIQSAIGFLDHSCTIRYAFRTEVSTKPDLTDCCLSTPNIFDTGFIVKVLSHAGISLCLQVQNTIRSLLLESRNDHNLFNFFHPEFPLLLPADVDTSSVSTTALISLGLPKQEIEQMAKNIHEKASYRAGGLPDVYFRNLYSNNIKYERTGYYDILGKWPVIQRVDYIVTSNFLYLQAKAGFAEKFEALFEFMDAGIKAMDENKESFLKKYFKNYTNLDLVCFMISRLKNVDIQNCCIDWNVLRNVVVRRMKDDNLPVDVVSLSCRIIAGINTDVHEIPNGKAMIITGVQKLISMQKNDGSFTVEEFYNAHKKFFFGSAAVSTALAVAAIKLTKDFIPELELKMDVNY